MPISDYFDASTWQNPHFLQNAILCFFIFAAVAAVAALAFHFSSRNRWAVAEVALICVVGWMVCEQLIPSHGSRLGMYAIMGRNAGKLSAIGIGASFNLYQILRSAIMRRRRGFPVKSRTTGP